MALYTVFSGINCSLLGLSILFGVGIELMTLEPWGLHCNILYHMANFFYQMIQFPTVCPCYNGPRYNGNLVTPDAPTSQPHLTIVEKLKFWLSRYNGNLVLHVCYSKGRLYLR